MIALVLWFLVAFGIAFVLGQSKISFPVRVVLGGRAAQNSGAVELTTGLPAVDPAIRPLVPVLGPFIVALVECPGCLGWWLGLVVGAFLPSLVCDAAPALLFDTDVNVRVLSAMVLSFSTSAVNLLLARYVGIV